MALLISHSSLSGVIDAAPSKSYTHRALILGALSGSKFRIQNPLISDDTASTMAALSMMGTVIEKTHDAVMVELQELKQPQGMIDVGNSGTTLRLISGTAALISGETGLTGDESIRKRPVKPLLDALRELGVKCKGTGPGELPPVTIQGPMTGSRAHLPGDISSQFISSLLLSCPFKESDTELEITSERKSKLYIDVTLHMLRALRIKVDVRDNGYWIKGGQRPKGKKYDIPGDFSSASFPMIGAAVTGGVVTIRGLDPKISQADALVIDALERYGAEVVNRRGSIVCSGAEKKPFEFDVSDSPDLFPILAVLASTTEGQSTLSGGEHLRFKESDRISTTVAMLSDIGVKAETRDDGCVVHGTGRIRGGVVRTQRDHRIMMAATIAGLASEEGVKMDDDNSYAISYPRFLDDIRSLGGDVKEVTD